MESSKTVEGSDPDEFYRLLTQHQPRLRGFVRCLLLNTSEVDDVLQETNVVLLRKSGDFQPGTNFWAWASTVARFEVLGFLRRRGRRKDLFGNELLLELAAVAQEKADTLDHRRHALAVCFEKLPPASRQLLEMRYSLGRSIGTIAEATDRPEGSIRQTLYRIRRALHDCILVQLATPE